MIISCEEMKAMDSYAINEIGIPSIVLMENAALKILKNIDRYNIDSFTIVCGVGNNGGDGLAVVRHLILKGKSVDLYIIGNLEKSTRDFNINLSILDNMDVNYIHIKDEDNLDKFKSSIRKNALTIDSIFGIGLTRDVEGLFYETINIINNYSNQILSIDIPSGLDGDSGHVLGISVKADTTISFHKIKKGLDLNKDFPGKVILEDISIPEQATSAVLNMRK